MTAMCAGCGKETPDNHPILGNGHDVICMPCEGTTIQVFKLEYGGSSFVDRYLENVLGELSDIEVGDEYTISKIEMRLEDYLCLPEFEGF